MNQLQELNDKITSFNVEVEKLKNIKSDFDKTDKQVKDLDKKISDIDNKYYVEVQNLNLNIGDRLNEIHSFLMRYFIDQNNLNYVKKELEAKIQENTEQSKTNKTKIEKNQQDITILQDKVKDLGGETKDFAIYGPLFANSDYTFDKDNFEIRENVKSGIPFLGNVYVIKEGEFTKEFPLIITNENALCFIKKMKLEHHQQM